MKKILFLTSLIIISISSVKAQKPLNEFWEQTLDAWDSGNFISALEDFEKILLYIVSYLVGDKLSETLNVYIEKNLESSIKYFLAESLKKQ